MNKRILALLLAGLMTASMAACTVGGGNGKATGDGGTEPTPNRPGMTTGAPVINFVDVNDTVYTVADGVRLLTSMDSATGAVTVGKITELHRVKYSATWSVVEYNGVQYYVTSQSLTADDILGKGFTACDPTTKYVNTAKLKIRPYASLSDSFSKDIATVSLNDTVTVVGFGTVGGMDWSKIKYVGANQVEQICFVSSKYLSDSLVQDPEEIDYSEYFEDCEPTTMYVIAEETLTLRKVPNSSNEIEGNWLGTVANGDTVVVIAKGTGEYEGWVQLKVPHEKENPEDPQFYFYPYVVQSFLSKTQGGEAITLEGLLDAYPAFDAVNKTLYVSNEVGENALNVRSAPDFDADNIIDGFAARTALKVVAEGESDGVFCYLVEFTKNEKTVYGFVSAKFVTPASDGTPAQTLDALLSGYTGFTKLTASKTYVASAAVGCSFELGSDWSSVKTIAKDAEVTVVAEGSYQGADLCVVEIEGIYYFASADNLVEKAAE